MRKSPYKHPVKAHTRKGYPVTNYERGRGKKPRTRSRPRKFIASGDSFNIQIFYEKEPSETFTQSGKNYAEVINPSLLRRKSPKNPTIMMLEEMS